MFAANQGRKTRFFRALTVRTLANGIEMADAGQAMISAAFILAAIMYLCRGRTGRPTTVTAIRAKDLPLPAGSVIESSTAPYQ
jgi:hypothetical protein